ncbi:MAG: hypothetical protein WB439_00170 [Acidobacteriaceae bacterium]
MKRLLTLVLVLLSFSGVYAVAQSAILLSNVRKVYIEKMDNGLDQYLASAISAKFHGTLTVVLNRDAADAILRGEGMTAQQTQNGTVQLVDKNGSTVLWSGSAGDKSLMTLGLKHNGEKQVADHLISELKKAMQP